MRNFYHLVVASSSSNCLHTHDSTAASFHVVVLRLFVLVDIINIYANVCVLYLHVNMSNSIRAFAECVAATLGCQHHQHTSCCRLQHAAAKCFSNTAVIPVCLFNFAAYHDLWHCLAPCLGDSWLHVDCI